MALIHLANRVVILADGPDAEHLLQNTLTLDLAQMKQGEARPGALLTPQGKILFDFMISRVGTEAFRLDCRQDIAADFIKRMTLLRVRAKVNFILQEQELVSVSWQDDSTGSHKESTVIDMRFPASFPIQRHYGPQTKSDVSLDEWNRIRIDYGAPESGSDYELLDAFPHDILFDQNGGIGLKKGCYVGQEVVSRMHHRGTARRRLVIVEATTNLSPESDHKNITSDGRPIGQLGTISGNKALAIIRIDRAIDAQAAGIPILCNEVELALHVPAYASFSLTATGGSESNE